MQRPINSWTAPLVARAFLPAAPRFVSALFLAVRWSTPECGADWQSASRMVFGSAGEAGQFGSPIFHRVAEIRGDLRSLESSGEAPSCEAANPGCEPDFYPAQPAKPAMVAHPSSSGLPKSAATPGVQSLRQRVHSRSNVFRPLNVSRPSVSHSRLNRASIRRLLGKSLDPAPVS